MDKSVADLRKQIEELGKQIREIQAQCPHNLQERYRSGLAGYHVVCLGCEKVLQACWGILSEEERATYKEVAYTYIGCEDPEAHKMYHVMGAFCPCR